MSSPNGYMVQARCSLGVMFVDGRSEVYKDVEILTVVQNGLPVEDRDRILFRDGCDLHIISNAYVAEVIYYGFYENANSADGTLRVPTPAPADESLDG